MKSKRSYLNQKLALMFLLGMTTTLPLACGKRRPPIPPVKPRSSINLTALQRGNEIILSVAIPQALKQQIKQINFYRLSETLAQSTSLTQDDFLSRATQIAVVETASDQNLKEDKQVLYTDALSNYLTGLRLRYAITFVYQDGRRSAFSNFALVTPSATIALAPEQLRISVTQKAVRLEWEKANSASNNNGVGNLLGYNVYRINQKQGSEPQLLNPTLIQDNFFEDERFEFGSNYQYFVRSVSLGENGTRLESSNSNLLSLTPRDTFAPAPPQNLTIAAAPGNLSLFFAANTEEADVIGYNVYRATDETRSLTDWEKINSELIKTTTYQDVRVESGQKYYYYVIAIDNAGNLSAPSEVVSETAL